ncbi:MAG: pirin family protein [Prevotellaceae bacterium]|jgi:redox-sensitive bicupin YhaK (pirin superfamily)|nr:pirin family protein [Prevotellaceae bacterium]
MIKYIDSKKMGRGIHGWLDSYFHFSFADYCNPKNVNFGILRVLNDDIVQPQTGFDMHPHRDMEIISYVVEGELSHEDSHGNRRTLTRGQSQYMSAGTGIWHSEYNWAIDKRLRFLQIWILPDKKNLAPNYGDYLFNFDDRRNKWLPLATGVANLSNPAPIKIHADINAYSTVLSAGKTLDFEIDKNRQAYLVLIEGSVEINGICLSTRDAAEIVEENIVLATADGEAHALIIEMAKSE